MIKKIKLTVVFNVLEWKHPLIIHSRKQNYSLKRITRIASHRDLILAVFHYFHTSKAYLHYFIKNQTNNHMYLCLLGENIVWAQWLDSPQFSFVLTFTGVATIAVVLVSKRTSIYTRFLFHTRRTIWFWKRKIPRVLIIVSSIIILRTFIRVIESSVLVNNKMLTF